MFVYTVSLNAAQLERLVREETIQCTSLGIQLKIPFPRLHVLEKQSMTKRTITHCFEEMCYYWLYENDEDRKWSEVYKALEQQGNRRLKAILEEKHKADTKGNNYHSRMF